MNTTVLGILTTVFTQLTDVSVATTPAPPQYAGTPVTLTATATGGTNVQYQFWVYNPAVTPAWSCLQAYSSLTTCTWTPETAGVCLLSITAQDGATGTEVNTMLWYTISTGAQLTGVSVTPSLLSPQQPDTPITLTATATGGANVQFQFWVYNASSTTATWSQLQAYSSADTCLWIPAQAVVPALHHGQRRHHRRGGE